LKSLSAIIASLGKQLQDFTVAHDVRLVGSDGVYQIDVLASYTALGVKMMVLIECKHYSSPVPREKIQILYDKMRSTGAQKGILFSTAGFQDGAIEYALRHKIALIRMLSDRFENVTNKIKKDNSTRLLPIQGAKMMGEFLSPGQTGYIKPGKIGALISYLSA